jgi:hypothetical protein
MVLIPFLYNVAFVNQNSTQETRLSNGHAAWGYFKNNTYLNIMPGQAGALKNNDGIHKCLTRCRR